MSDRKLNVCDWVYLKAQTYGQLSITNHHYNKLSYKYYGHYMITERVGQVAYKFALPPKLQLHPTFHVSPLKPFFELPKEITHPPVLDITNPYCPQRLKVLQRRIIQKGHKAVTQWLIQLE